MTQMDIDANDRPQTVGRVPPSALEAEESLIGAMLLSPEAVSVAYETVSPEDFYRPLHGQIFSAIIALANAGEPVDYVTVQAKLQEHGAVGGGARGAVLAADEHAVGGQRAALRRAGARQGPAASTHRGGRRDRRRRLQATDDVVGLIDEAERKINQIGDDGAGSTRSRRCSSLLLNEADILEERGETRGQLNGLETGYRVARPDPPGTPAELDDDRRRAPGHRQDRVRPGHPVHVGAVVKRPALYFSLEMSRQELAERILASTARIDSSKLRTGDLSDADWNRAHEAFGFLQSAKVFIDDNPSLTVMDVRARARRIKQQNGDLGVVIVDYLQLMSSRGRAENRQVEVAEMSRSLKILARELQAPVIALSQLSRKLEERADKRPMMSDLRESGSLEQDADVVLFLFRPEQYGEVPNDKKADAEIIVGKNRNGPTRTAHLTWRGEFARFDNVADAREI